MAKRTDAVGLRSQSRLMGMLANANRLRICILLTQDEFDVSSLAFRVGLSQSALSQHLARLLRSGLVSCRRKAQFRFYRCDHVGVAAILRALEDIYCNASHSSAIAQSKPPEQSPTDDSAPPASPVPMQQTASVKSASVAT